MKKKYIQPNVSVSFVVGESQLLAGTVTGIEYGPGFPGGGLSKKHDFSSWDFDEEDESESNFSSKSLWD